MSTTELWDKLGKTDPKHTKGFSRAGGFKGTAIKPMWAYRRMTEEFGACGVGWGINQPSFEVVHADGEILVYCTVSMWHGKRDHVVYGVGGDKVVSKRRDGSLFSDDEAFKKAFTDAITNSLKLIGVGADVHMGLFDDAKYVNEMAQEFAESEYPSRDRFVLECKKNIDAFAPADPKLLEWWNSDEQKKIRRDFEVTKPQLEELKALVVGRMGIKKATADA